MSREKNNTSSPSVTAATRIRNNRCLVFGFIRRSPSFSTTLPVKQHR